MWSTCDQVRRAGEGLQMAAEVYSNNPLDKKRRRQMENRASELLNAATRLLVLVDFIDISKLMQATSRVCIS